MTPCWWRGRRAMRKCPSKMQRLSLLTGIIHLVGAHLGEARLHRAGFGVTKKKDVFRCDEPSALTPSRWIFITQIHAHHAPLFSSAVHRAVLQPGSAERSGASRASTSVDKTGVEVCPTATSTPATLFGSSSLNQGPERAGNRNETQMSVQANIAVRPSLQGRSKRALQRAAYADGGAA